MILRTLLFILIVATIAAFGLFTQANAHPHGGGHWPGGFGHYHHHGGGYIDGDWDDDEFCGWHIRHHRRVWVCD
jgi:hypothetical protein